jgi:hypothetical protein
LVFANMEKLMTEFSLKKWYMDAADGQGNVFIGYWVALHWRSLALSGYQYLWHTPGKDINTQTEFSKQPEPVWQSPDSLSWQLKNLNARWISMGSGIEKTIKLGKGEIEWRCIQPKAKAKIELSQFAISGWGYTEYININVPIWKLPFHTLHWGRTHSDNHYLAWIKLEGIIELNTVWLDGQPDNSLTISDRQIHGSGFNLELGENTPLRGGKVISTVLSPYKYFIKLFPKNAFLMDEQKWYNLGMLKTDNTIEKAISIYEKVTW